MPRNRKPIAELKAKGTFRKDRHAGRVSELVLPAGSLGPPPAWFGAAAIEEWDRLTKEMAAILNPAHRSALVALCGLTQRETDDFTGGDKITASERQTLHSLRMQFAVMPASQTKVKLPESKPVESKWAATKPTPISQQA